jgi:hypothetical protein
MKRVGAVVLALVLVAAAVLPVAAQEPEGDVGAAQSIHAGFCVNPNSNTTGAPNCPITGVNQIVPSGGVASTEVTVRDVDNLGSVQIAFNYDSSIVRIKDIRPGSLFDNLTMGVDYTIDKSKIGGFAAPLDPLNEPPIPGVCGTGTGPCWRSYIFITIYNWNTSKVPLHGNGSLIRIYWQVQPVAALLTTNVTFSILSLANRSGSSLWPCFPDVPLPNPYCGPAPVPAIVAVAPDAVLEVGSPSTAGLQFQVALEGGKTPGDDDPNCNFPSPNPAPPPAVCVNDVTAVAGVFVDVADMAGNIFIPFAASYPTVTVSRPGYLTARATNVLPGADLGMVTLLAGDVTGDNVVNIFDLTVTAGSLGAPVGTSTALEMMDFNEDGVVTITDLALIANNYNMSGPRPITVIQ